MILGKLKRGRVIVEDASDASTLRNKGYLGKNLGERLSLDFATSADLVMRRKMQVLKGGNVMSLDQLEAMMSPEERKMAAAYHFLRAKGMKPVIRNGRIYAYGKNVAVFREDETVRFNGNKVKQFLMAIVDSEGSCLVYSVSRLGLLGRSGGRTESRNDSTRGGLLTRLLTDKGMTVASGFKFGAEFRLYKGKSSHAKYLMTEGEESLARDVVGRVRIAQSVRKSYVQAAFDREKEKFTFLEIRWIRL
ncbi:MAG: hypothetical protein ACP5UZ_00550 [Thermoplasmata archaeon]